jgi:hypothetical protein
MTTAPGKRSCMTCLQVFADDDPAVFIRPEAFEDICICAACVQVYRKEISPGPSARE